MISEPNNNNENTVTGPGSNALLYISGAITFCFLIAVATFYWHAGNIEGGLAYPYDRGNKFPGLRLHEGIASFLSVAWFLAFLLMFFSIPYTIWGKRKVSWKAVLFCITSQVMLFLYFKYSSFLGWIIT